MVRRLPNGGSRCSAQARFFLAVDGCATVEDHPSSWVCHEAHPTKSQLSGSL
jgi:hypothetical protein